LNEPEGFVSLRFLFAGKTVIFVTLINCINPLTFQPFNLPTFYLRYAQNYPERFFPLLCGAAFGQADRLRTAIDREADKLEPKMIEWRRHFHQNPELSNRK
jgi:hypothetical protein